MKRIKLNERTIKKTLMFVVAVVGVVIFFVMNINATNRVWVIKEFIQSADSAHFYLSDTSGAVLDSQINDSLATNILYCPVTIEETKWYSLNLRIFYTNEDASIPSTYTEWWFPNIQPNIVSELDTLSMASGFFGGGTSIYKRYAAVDTLFIMRISTDTVVALVTFHPGGSPGGRPDSSRTIWW